MERHESVREKAVGLHLAPAVLDELRGGDGLEVKQRDLLLMVAVSPLHVLHLRPFEIHLLAHYFEEWLYLRDQARPLSAQLQRVLGKIAGQTVRFAVLQPVRIGEDSELYEAEALGQPLRAVIGGTRGGVNHVHQPLVLGNIIQDQLHHGVGQVVLAELLAHHGAEGLGIAVAQVHRVDQAAHHAALAFGDHPVIIVVLDGAAHLVFVRHYRDGVFAAVDLGVKHLDAAHVLELGQADDDIRLAFGLYHSFYFFMRHIPLCLLMRSVL